MERDVVLLPELEAELGRQSPFDMNMELDFWDSSYKRVVQRIDLLLP